LSQKDTPPGSKYIVPAAACLKLDPEIPVANNVQWLCHCDMTSPEIRILTEGASFGNLPVSIQAKLDSTRMWRVALPVHTGGQPFLTEGPWAQAVMAGGSAAF
jgi:hypothetical protein